MAIDDLATLIREMSPVLAEDEYVFEARPIDSARQLTVNDARLLFVEEEGVTVVRIAQPDDEAPRFRCITLQVHSALEAVGFTAAFGRALTEAEVPCNVVAGYHHDHVFVPANLADRAMRALEALRREY